VRRDACSCRLSRTVTLIVSTIINTPLWHDAPIHVETLSAPIASLTVDEVLVFGSNKEGFHGAGAAGLAWSGRPNYYWKQEEERVLEIRRSPPDDERRIGAWAIFGWARGIQIGHTGTSYAIQTVEQPGQRQSVSRREIFHQLGPLLTLAKSWYDCTFIVTALGEGLGGYSRAEMGEVWREAHARHGIPENMRFARMEK
jgi:hypothetical protein